MLVLAGDIGGTKTNIGLFEVEPLAAKRSVPLGLEEMSYPSPVHTGLEEIVADFIDHCGAPSIRTAAFGVAGPVVDNRVKTPNLPWLVDGDDLGARFGIEAVVLMNDLVATAEGIEALRSDELVTLQEGTPLRQPATCALIAAGTGLGMAILAPHDGRLRPLPSEGGHVDLAPRNAEEQALLEFMWQRYPDHVSVERVAAGPGLVHLVEFVAERGPEVMLDAARAEITSDPASAPALISKLGLGERCPVCARALKIFVSLYASAAGNLALTALALGGVYLGGGIAPRILPALQRDDAFMAGFLAKGRYRELLGRIPVKVILNQKTAVLGAARVARRLAETAGTSTA